MKLKDKLKDDFFRLRRQTLNIVSPLEIEDLCVQPIPEVSPPKWHLGHTTWFYERLILQKYLSNYQPVNAEFYHHFNSYYKSLGSHWIRADRGHCSRPTVKEIFQYREIIDERMGTLLEKEMSPEFSELLLLGLNHEQQHQELLLMDIKNILFHQPTNISYLRDFSPNSVDNFNDFKSSMKIFDGGLIQIGVNYNQNAFMYDNEGPQHRYFIEPFKLSDCLVTIGDYLEFIEENGYERPEFWLSDGWSWINENNIKSPLYWVKKENQWFEYDFTGLELLNPSKPVSHISYYEASAYARFKKKRLPTEFEWEYVTQKFTEGEQGFFNGNVSLLQGSNQSFSDLHGHLWQWTQSAYLPYSGHMWDEGPLGEYNSKFMINQMVLRGGSYTTEKSHYRPTYRNYFYPHDRWAFTGLRLAEDV